MDDRSRSRTALLWAGLLILLTPPNVCAAEPSPPTGVVRLRDALAATLVSSPELVSHSAEIRAREGQALQAGLLPNPEFDVEVEDVAGSGAQHGFRGAQTTLSLSQLVELGGKRSERIRLADLDRDLAGWDYEVARLDALASTARAFVAVLAADRHLALADELVELGNSSIAAVDAQVHVGAVSPVESLRAQVALGRAQADRLDAERELAVAKSRLAASWGATEVTFDRVEGDLERIEPPPPLAVLADRIARNPDLARWTAELSQREAMLRLEDAGRIPDLTLALGGRHYAETDDGALVFGFSVPLPVFDRKQGVRLEAAHRLTKAKADRDAIEVATRSAVAIAHTEMRVAFEQTKDLTEEAIPQARAVFEGALDAYRKGLFRYIETLDAQRTLFELQAQRLQTLAAYHSAAIEIERLTGVSLAAPDDEGNSR